MENPRAHLRVNMFTCWPVSHECDGSPVPTNSRKALTHQLTSHVRSHLFICLARAPVQTGLSLTTRFRLYKESPLLSLLMTLFRGMIAHQPIITRSLIPNLCFSIKGLRPPKINHDLFLHLFLLWQRFGYSRARVTRPLFARVSSFP